MSIPDPYKEFQTEEQRLQAEITRLRETCHALQTRLSEARELLKECQEIANSGESDIRALPWDEIDQWMEG